MVLNYDNQKTIDILKYAKKLNFKERVLLAINILESNYIVVKDDAVLKELYRILGKIDEQDTKTNYINFFDYKHLLVKYLLCLKQQHLSLIIWFEQSLSFLHLYYFLHCTFLLNTCYCHNLQQQHNCPV